MAKYGRGGPDTIVCGDCGGVLYWEPLAELWLHRDDDSEECLDRGRNADPI